MAACLVATFVVLESEAGREATREIVAPTLARSMAGVPKAVPLLAPESG